MSTDNLERFKTAQSDPVSGFEAALAEIKSGRKRSHWIWYVFPQLSGLGTSSLSELYAIEAPAEAVEYLEDPVLSVRLLTITTAAAERVREGVPLATLMGSRVDVTKLVSSLTLFAHVAGDLSRSRPSATLEDLVAAAGAVLEAAESEGYPRCRFTLDHLRIRGG
jgi:uncharacterized protein (DUF1810 family)